MRIHEALQRTDGRFDYTTRTGSSGVLPIGYCGGWRYDEMISRREKDMAGIGFEHDHLLEGLKQERDEALAFQDRYHTDGHATAEEAHDCYVAYLLDMRLRFYLDKYSQQRCAVCDEWTQGRARFAGDGFGRELILCPAHQDRESAAGALKKRDES